MAGDPVVNIAGDICYREQVVLVLMLVLLSECRSDSQPYPGATDQASLSRDSRVSIVMSGTMQHLFMSAF